MIKSYKLFEYTRNPTNLKSILKKIYLKIGENSKYDIFTFDSGSKMSDNKHSKITDNNDISGNYKFLQLSLYDIQNNNYDKYLNSIKHNLENYNIILSYDCEPYYNIYIKDSTGKRVIPPKFVYHTTDSRYDDSIEKNGIIPVSPLNYEDFKILDYFPSIFASTTKPPRQNPYNIPGALVNTVWEIDTKKTPNIKWWEDLNLHGYEHLSAIMTFNYIPPEIIRPVLIT